MIRVTMTDGRTIEGAIAKIEEVSAAGVCVGDRVRIVKGASWLGRAYRGYPEGATGTIYEIDDGDIDQYYVEVDNNEGLEWAQEVERI